MNCVHARSFPYGVCDRARPGIPPPVKHPNGRSLKRMRLTAHTPPCDCFSRMNGFTIFLYHSEFHRVCVRDWVVFSTQIKFYNPSCFDWWAQLHTHTLSKKIRYNNNYLYINHSMIYIWNEPVCVWASISLSLCLCLWLCVFAYFGYKNVNSRECAPHAVTHTHTHAQAHIWVCIESALCQSGTWAHRLFIMICCTHMYIGKVTQYRIWNISLLLDRPPALSLLRFLVSPLIIACKCLLPEEEEVEENDEEISRWT